ncbi:phage major capsid protein [bacterium]|nr:phage major capsid protein [bacterium]
MATQTLTNFDAILKNVYRGPIVEQLNQESYAIDQFERVAANDMGAFSGRQVIFPIHTGRNRGRGAIGDGGVLPAAGTQGFHDGTVSIRYFAQGIELTDQVIKQSETNEGAFVRAMTAEVEGATTDLRKDINRQVYGTGDGVLSNISTATTSATFTVDNVQYISVGDYVDIIKSDGTTYVATNVQVTAVSSTGTAGSSTQAQGSITLASAPSATTGTNASICLTGAYKQESDGFRNITATSGALHGLDPTVAVNGVKPAVWKGTEIDATYATTGLEDLYIQAAQAIRKVSAKGPDVFLTTLGAQRKLAAQFTSQKRWQDAKSLEMQEGYSAIMVAAGAKPIPVIADVDAPVGFAFALNKGSFAWTELQKPDWLTAPDGKGSILTLKTGSAAGTREAKWQAWLGWYAALACTARNQNGRIKNLVDDTPVARV